MKKYKITLYEQDFNAEDIFLYVPASLIKKLSKKDRQAIKKAVCLMISGYKNRFEQNYLDRMLI